MSNSQQIYNFAKVALGSGASNQSESNPNNKCCKYICKTQQNIVLSVQYKFYKTCRIVCCLSYSMLEASNGGAAILAQRAKFLDALPLMGPKVDKMVDKAEKDRCK